MNSIRNQFPLLWQFFGGYFHQDWMEDYENEEEVIRESVYNEGAEEAYRTLHMLDQLMALGLSEDELNGAMETDFSCDYTPEPDGITMSEWLRWVRDTMSKYAAEKSAEEKKSQG